MQKQLLLTLPYILFCFFSQAQTFDWAKAGSSSSASKMVCDSSGNFYVTGSFGLAKYDPTGNFIWQQTITGTDCLIRGIVVDTASNLYVTGAFGGTVNIGAYTLISEAGGDANMFLVKYNTGGIIQWITRSHSNRDSGTDDLTIDKQGNPIIIGRFYDSLRLDSFTFRAPETNQIFLAKYSSSGICLWAKQLVSASFDGGWNGPKIKSDKLGNTYITGHYIGDSAQFDNINIIPYHYSTYYGQDIFLAKIDSFGNFLWVKNLGGLGQEISGPMDVDSIGNIYLSGYFSSAPAYFDSYTLTTSTYSYFTTKYDPNGNALWAKHASAIVISAANDGYYTNYPSLITKYNALGSLQWTKSVPGASNNAMVAINNDVYITGSYIGSVNFDTSSLSSATNQMYIAKLSNLPITTTIYEPENDSNFSAYPNPTNSTVTISIKSIAIRDCKLNICNSLGKSVYSENIKANADQPAGQAGSYTKQIDLNHLPKGIYLVELVENSSNTPKQVVKLILQ